MKTEEKVKEFMEIFQRDDVKSSPGFPSNDAIRLRFNLIFEELLEFAEGNGFTALNLYVFTALEYVNKARKLCQKETEPDLVKVFDALLDLRYVVDGAIVIHGMTDQFEKGFEEVHRSNMSKADRNYMSVLETREYYEKQNISTTIKGSNGIFFNVRDADGKAMKSKYYSPANLTPILYGTEEGKVETTN
jgi:predicted HAD superfamily Cof-like phosphohydrolase